MARKFLKLTTHDEGQNHWKHPKVETPFYIATYAIAAFAGHTEQGTATIYDEYGNPVYKDGREERVEWSKSGTMITFQDENGNKRDRFVTETPDAIADMIVRMENG